MIVIGEELHNFFFLQKLRSKTPSIFRFQVNSCNVKKLLEGKRKQCKLIIEVPTLSFLIHKIRTSLISHYSASLVFQNNLATSAGKTKTKITDNSSMGQFYQLGFSFLSVFTMFTQRCS